eukprot:NODE_174_length_15906_cov_0.510533.p5 type:complete len:281 gc:universal NODE_174_length_15906_cov_0.510533:2693-3535(+)
MNFFNSIGGLFNAAKNSVISTGKEDLSSDEIREDMIHFIGEIEEPIGTDRLAANRMLRIRRRGNDPSINDKTKMLNHLTDIPNMDQSENLAHGYNADSSSTSSVDHPEESSSQIAEEIVKASTDTEGQTSISPRRRNVDDARFNSYGRNYKHFKTIDHSGGAHRDNRGNLNISIKPVGLNKGEIHLNDVVPAEVMYNDDKPEDWKPVFTDQYDKYIEQGLRVYGSSWKMIWRGYRVFAIFTSDQVKSRGRVLKKRMIRENLIRQERGEPIEPLGIFENLK